jgi:hypothetical protein
LNTADPDPDAVGIEGFRYCLRRGTRHGPEQVRVDRPTLGGATVKAVPGQLDPDYRPRAVAWQALNIRLHEPEDSSKTLNHGANLPGIVGAENTTIS